jgi:cytochrome c oxidase assembly factor 5
LNKNYSKNYSLSSSLFVSFMISPIQTQKLFFCILLLQMLLLLDSFDVFLTSIYKGKMSGSKEENASHKCDGLRYDLKLCLLDSECVKVHNKTPKECIKDPEMAQFVSDKCFALANAFFECKRSTIDMRNRFRGPKGY